jgi:hypothetical protein
MDVRRVRAAGAEAVEDLVLAVRYELVFFVAVEPVDIGRTAPPEMDRVKTREVDRDAVDELAEDGDMRIDGEVVVDLRIGV